MRGKMHELCYIQMTRFLKSKTPSSEPEFKASRSRASAGIHSSLPSDHQQVLFQHKAFFLVLHSILLIACFVGEASRYLLGGD